MILRIGVILTFLGHGILAFQQKAQWFNYLEVVGIPVYLQGTILKLIGILDVLLALLTVWRPFKPVLLWMSFWAFLTALMRPISGEPWLEFVERGANWTAPLALYILENRRK